MTGLSSRLPRRVWLPTARHPIVWLLTAGLVIAVPGLGSAAEGDPSWTVPPAELGKVYVTGSISVGGTIDYDLLRAGFGASFIFRPLAAEDFLGFLYRWNTSMVLQADYRPVAEDRRLLAGDFILRRYEHDMRSSAATGSTFWGLGVGAAEATAPADAPTGDTISWTFLLEVGHEWNPSRNLVFFAKCQLRWFDHHGLDYSNWSVHGGAGIPVFW